jgi:hypothetical protein
MVYGIAALVRTVLHSGWSIAAVPPLSGLAGYILYRVFWRQLAWRIRRW